MKFFPVTPKRSSEGMDKKRGMGIWLDQVKTSLLRFFGAMMRGFFVLLLIATPSLLLPGISLDTKQMVIMIGMFAGLLTVIEYSSVYPSLVEFRYAPPFNRVRFISLFLIVFVLSIIFRGATEETTLTRFVAAIGALIGHVIDFPYSPVRLMILMLPEDANPEHVRLMRAATGLSYLISLVSLAVFLILMRLHGWPNRRKAFNVWTNLPTFDPTMGGDVVTRLRRDARFNIALAFFLPFLTPAVAKSASGLFDASMVGSPQTLVWMIALWAFLPSSLFMRGIAMNRIGDMIDEKRMRGTNPVQAGMLPA
ncbi:MAG: hypothetical protein AAGA12_05510 [Pseudomonadota bacterium]